jgi:hypothetical protein
MSRGKAPETFDGGVLTGWGRMTRQDGEQAQVETRAQRIVAGAHGIGHRPPLGRSSTAVESALPSFGAGVSRSTFVIKS